MSRRPLILSQRDVSNAKLGLRVAMGVSGITIGLAALLLLQAKMHAADLADQVRMQKTTLSALRRSVQQPVATVAADPTSGDAVGKLQTDLERTAKSVHCTVSEFQTMTERSPYLSVFSLETNQPGWEQVPIHVTLNGTLAATLATVESLRKCNSPFEPDSIEISRQAVSENGASEVSLRLTFRVLVRTGAKA